MEKETFHPLSLCRKSVGKVLENLGKISVVSGILSADSWRKLELCADGSGEDGSELEGYLVTDRALGS